MTSLADGLEEANACGNRDVEAGYGAEHWDAEEKIACLGCEVSHPFAFGAHDDGERAGEFGGVERLACFMVAGAGDPDSAVFKFNEGVAEIVSLDDGNAFGGADGYFSYRFIYRC